MVLTRALRQKMWMVTNAKPARRENYIRQWRKHRGLTQEQLAEAVGVATATISQIETGKQGFTDTSLYAIAEALHVTAGDLLSGPPAVSGAPAGTEVPLMGYLGAGAEVEPDFEQVPPEGLDQVSLPFDLDDDLIAFKVRGDSMLPFYRDGATIVVFREQKRPLTTFYGEEAAVRTSNGRRFIKTIMRGDGDSVTLTSWNAAPIENVRLEWIGEIFAVLPPAAMKKAIRQGGVQGQLRLKTA
ncbi:MAG: helix-turn-helix domain-containing protein [Mesorhizobium sp.]|nr:helix-turn-helix domain-containing protein [Mesorhizobium sp.]MCO5085118.1 helix-turn-helix domain-containing protein [Rhizobiaceae bacterium]MCO5164628.1 helix-turn-helix domain-containing protein [Mesorhizobium sp.]